MNSSDWLFDILRCPETGDCLRKQEDALIRPDGMLYPIINGIPSLVFPPASVGEDAKWQGYYDWFAPLYDLNERVLGRLLTGVSMIRERARIISLVGLKPGMRVLEVSPGPGVYQADIRTAIGTTAEYAALDLSLGMLRQCQVRNEGLGVTLIQGNGAHLPFANDCFDALFHFGGVNLFSEPLRALSEFVRVVRRGGVVAWGDEGFSTSLPDGWKKRFLSRMNPGFLKQPPPVPEGLDNVVRHEVMGGFAYLIVARKI